jgi:hypothetical protein
MKTVAIDVETVLDEGAAERCGYTPTDEFAPFPLHEIVCASAFSLTRVPDGQMLYAVESFSRGIMSERAIVASIEEAVSDANVVVTFNGGRFDLPVLLTRAMLHEVHVPRLVDLQNRSRVGRHYDLFEDVKRDATPVSLALLCAPFSIPVKQRPAARVDELVATSEWAALEAYCEMDAIACWLAAQFWTKVQDPSLARESWRDFAGWIRDNNSGRPSLAPFLAVAEAP